MSPKKAINLFTIGFTQKSAEQFFDTLIESGVRRVIDTRLNIVVITHYPLPITHYPLPITQ
jgi:hypothetical protein